MIRAIYISLMTLALYGANQEEESLNPVKIVKTHQIPFSSLFSFIPFVQESIAISVSACLPSQGAVGPKYTFIDQAPTAKSMKREKVDNNSSQR